MDGNNYEQLRARFPHMYSNVVCGCDHPSGWDDLVMELSARLYEACPEIRVVQTKQKFGDLCFYADDATQEARDIISEYENRSSIVCERCGASGARLRIGHGWDVTLCEECNERRYKEG